MPRGGCREPRRAAGHGRPDRPREVHRPGGRQALDDLRGWGGAARIRLVRGEPGPRRRRATGRRRAACPPTCAPRWRAPPPSRTRSGSRRGKNNDFGAFLPALRENLDLRKRYVECFEAADEPYDIVLDDYERGLKTAEVRRIFDYLKEHQAPLVKEIAALAEEPAPEHVFDLDAQKTFELEVVREFGFNDDAWRLDPTVHPFASGTGIDDIRITTRYFPDRPRRALRDDARVRSRALRASDRSCARALAARARRLARHARVAEPHVGEPRRALTAVLEARFFPRAPGAAPTPRGLRRRALVPRGEQPSSRR